MKNVVALARAYRLTNHGPTVLVSSAHGEHRNIMAAAWNMPLDFDPPKVAIVIDKNTYTRELVIASGSFAINVPCRAQMEMVVKVGSYSGRELIGKPEADKFAAHGIQTFVAEKIEAPLVEGCVAWLECKLIPEPHIQETYDLYLAEVVAAWADERVFSDGRWHFDGHDELRTLHHVAGGAFMTVSDTFQVKATDN
jgi:flavin reductase (DIM6/NTAB) family NADH-FMN oxidoreductase RutF